MNETLGFALISVLGMVASVVVSLVLAGRIVREANGKVLSFVEGQTDTFKQSLAQQSRLMAELVESVADRLMSKSVDDYRGSTPVQPFPMHETTTDPEQEMRDAGLDPEDPEAVDQWNSQIEEV